MHYLLWGKLTRGKTSQLYYNITQAKLITWQTIFTMTPSNPHKQKHIEILQMMKIPPPPLWLGLREVHDNLSNKWPTQPPWLAGCPEKVCCGAEIVEKAWEAVRLMLGLSIAGHLMDFLWILRGWCGGGGNAKHKISYRASQYFQTNIQRFIAELGYLDLHIYCQSYETVD